MTNKIKLPVDSRFPISFRFGDAPDWYVKIFKYPHNGCDFACPIGSVVKSCDSGVVIFVDDIPDQDGKGIVLKHVWGLSIYWYLSTDIAILGAEVGQSAVIGISGATGYVPGPHLHFGIKVLDDPAPGMRGWSDPEKYFDGVPAPADPASPVINHYMVRPGDSLWSIAQKLYGNGL